MNLYSIRNDLTNLYNPPFIAPSDIEAETMVRNAICGGRDIQLIVELENLDLYCIASFDPVKGKITPMHKNRAVKRLSNIPLPEKVKKILKGEKNHDQSEHIEQTETDIQAEAD